MITVIRDKGKHNEQTWRKEFPLFYEWMIRLCLQKFFYSIQMGSCILSRPLLSHNNNFFPAKVSDV